MPPYTLNNFEIQQHYQKKPILGVSARNSLPKKKMGHR